MRVPSERVEVRFTPVRLPKVLLVEGATPWHFFDRLVNTLEMGESIEIRDYRGINDLKGFLETFVTIESFKNNAKSLGIVRDAEGNAARALEAARTAVRTSGLPADFPVSFAILPDDESPGMIETLCLRSVQGLPVIGCIDRFGDCLAATGSPLPDGISRSKNIAQIYLATFAEVQPFVGLGAQRGAWPLESPVFDRLKDFIRAL